MTANTQGGPYRCYRDVIEQAIVDWLKDQREPITTPIDPRAIGDLSLRITKALEEEWLIDPAETRHPPASTEARPR